VFLEPAAQIGTVAVDRISDTPADRQVHVVGSLEHAYRQFRLGLKGERVGDVSGSPPWQVGAPLLRDVQLAINEGMAVLGDGGEEDANLTVLDRAADATKLGRDASGVVAALGEAALINDQDREDLRGCGRGGHKRGREQGLADQGA
jgi:hypothetical protein